MKEIWKDIKGYKDYYKISNLGRVKSLRRFRKNGNSGYFTKEKILKQNISKTGYYVIDLKKENKRKTFKTHRLIAIHFIPIIRGKNYVNHKNGIKTDNTLINLEWCTIKENNNHAILLGLKNDIGHLSPNSKLTKKQVNRIKTRFDSVKNMAILFNVNESTIYRVIRKETYKNLL